MSSAVGGRHNLVRVGWVAAVEADDGVEVHDAAALHLGDLAEGDPYSLWVDAARAGGLGRCGG